MMAASAARLSLPPLARLLSPLLALALLAAVPARGDLEVQLGMIEKKCFSDDLQRGELLVGIYSVSPNSNQQSDVIVSVMGPNDVPMYDNGGAAEGKFAFTASEAGVYTLCFTNNAMQQRSVKFRYDSGVRAKDYSSVAKKDNLKPIEVELKRLEETTMQIHEELQQARDSEVKMRAINESTSSRVLYFSIFSIAVLFLLSFSQILYLRSYFKKKKLID